MIPFVHQENILTVFHELPLQYMETVPDSDSALDGHIDVHSRRLIPSRTQLCARVQVEASV